MDPTVAIPLHFSLEMAGAAVAGLVAAWSLLAGRWTAAAGAAAWLTAGIFHAGNLLPAEDDLVLLVARLAGLLLVATALTGTSHQRALAAGLALLAGGFVWGAISGGEAGEMDLGAHLLAFAGALVVGWWVWMAAQISFRLRVLAAFVAVLTVVVVIAGGAVSRVAAIDERSAGLDDLGDRTKVVRDRLLDGAAGIAERARLLSPIVAPQLASGDPALTERTPGLGVWSFAVRDSEAIPLASDATAAYRPEEVVSLDVVARARSEGTVVTTFDVLEDRLATVAASPVFRPGGEPSPEDVIGVIVVGQAVTADRVAGDAAGTGRDFTVVGRHTISTGRLPVGELGLTQPRPGAVDQGSSSGWLWAAASLPTDVLLVVTSSDEAVATAATALVRAFLVAVLAAAALAVVAALWLSVRISRPMLDLADEAERVKSDFLASLSHELRTPLTPIRGYAEILRRGRMSGSDASEALDEIGQAAQRLERIVTLLLDVAAMDAGRFPLEAESLVVRDLLTGTAERWIGRSRRHTITVQAPKSLPRVSADPAIVQRALDELMDNAVKFSPEGGKVRLRGRKSAGGVEISVSNEGPGITEEQASALTAAFQQADRGDTRRFGGLGLGLAFVDGVARAHGGRLELLSKAGEGTTSAVTLPVAVSVTRMPRKTVTRKR